MPVDKSFKPGRSSSKIAGKGVTSAKAAALSDEVSASLGDQLLAEVEAFRTQGCLRRLGPTNFTNTIWRRKSNAATNVSTSDFKVVIVPRQPKRRIGLGNRKATGISRYGGSLYRRRKRSSPIRQYLLDSRGLA
jgi:hypothetical protein